jgi:hypothetical protein
MPGAIGVNLRSMPAQPHVASCLTLKFVVGETVFYNNNILHCATYSPIRLRATLHACIGDTRGGSIRARNILQHELEWMKEEAFRESLNLKGKQMLERLLRMQKEFHGKETRVFFRGMTFTG